MLIGLGLIGLLPARELPSAVIEAIAVDIVPVSELNSMRRGAETSQIVDTNTPSPVDTEAPAELAQPAGNTDEDMPIPQIADIPTPTPVENTAPAPPPEPEPEPAPIPEPEPPPPPPPPPEPEPAPPAPTPPPPIETATLPSPTPPTPAIRPTPAPTPAPEPEPEPPPPEPEPEPPAPEPEPEPEPPAPTPPQATTPPAPTPASRPSNLEQLRREYAQREEERRRREEEERRRQAAAQPAPTTPAPAPSPTPTPPADNISSIINQDATTGATTGQGGSATLGTNTGNSATLSQSEIAGLVAQIRQCWTVNLLPEELGSGLSVRLLVSMNRDGSVAGTPMVLEQDPSTIGGSMARSAQRAVMNCGPYRLSAETYSQWQELDVVLRP